MNNKLKITGFIILMVLCLQVKADKKKDVIKISLPNNTAVEIIGTDINKYKLDTVFITNYIDRLFNFCKTSNIEEMLETGQRTIEIKPDKGSINLYTRKIDENTFYELSIHDREIPNQIISSNDFSQNLHYLQKHQFQFENKHFTISILFDKLDQLKEIKGAKILNSIDSVMNNYYGQKSIFIEKINYQVNQDYSIKKVNENLKSSGDQIELGLGTGLESVKNTFATNLEASMTFIFHRKGIAKNSYGISYEWQYDFSDNFERKINHFMNINYKRDFSNDPDKSRAYTLKFGYLLNKNGELYKDDTFSLSVSRSFKHFYLEPKIYFNDAFKDIVPSIKIGISIF